MSNAPIPDDSVDALIASRLPAWLVTASPADVNKLHQSLCAQQHVQHQLRALFERVTPLDHFAEPLLKQALAPLMLDARTATLQLKTVVHFSPYVAGVPEGNAIVTRTQPLLAAALHNFSEGETLPLALLESSAVLDALGQRQTLTVQAFMRLCRTLDLGQRYQNHLRALFTPPGEAGQAIAALLEEGWRAGLDAALHLALLKGQVSTSTYLKLQPLLAPIAAERGAGEVTAMTLRVLGKLVRGAVAFEIRQTAAEGGALQGVLCWIANDPHGALNWYASWEALFRALARQLSVPAYATFFQGLISERDRADFTQALQASTRQGQAQLDGRTQAIDQPLFAYLRSTQVETLLDDAQVLAVPTAQVDRAERERRLQFYGRAGLDLLGLASFFVPNLGLPLLAIAALQLTNEVYEGYSDWRLGDRQAALQHLASVAENLAINAVTVGSGLAANKLLARSAFVDDLQAVHTEAGQLKLCSAQLPGYGLDDQELAVGQRGRLGEQMRLRAHADVYQVRGDAAHGELRIEHPQHPDAYAPLLEHNGAGSWRHELENPSEWQGQGMLLRRLGSALAELSDEVVSSVLHTTGFDEARLRRLHMEHVPAPARLLDAVQRYRLHEQYPALQGEAFEHLFSERQIASLPAAQLLRRDFPGLTSRSAQEIVEQAQEPLIERMLEQQRVPLALAEQARWCLHDSRLDRACAGLNQAVAINRDTLQLVLALVHDWSPWPASVRVEIREASLNGERLAYVGADDATEVRMLIKHRAGYQAVLGSDQMQATSSLSQALLQHLQPSQTLHLAEAAQSGDNLAKALAGRAFSQRGRCAELIGLAPIAGGMRPPLRLADGRLGYPLSGREPGNGRLTLRRGLRRLFVTFSDAQIEAFLASERARGMTPWAAYSELHSQLRSLRDALSAWRGGAGGPARFLRRSQVARRIRRAWQRQTRTVSGGFELSLRGIRVGSLPSLPETVDFTHVTHLSLSNLDLTSMPEGFLSRFGGVTHLDLSGNQLTAIPAELEHLTQLTELHLPGNQIVIDAQGSQSIAGLRRLQVLTLDHNPIGSVPELSRLAWLHSLSARDCGLSEMPLGVLRHANLVLADLRDNAIVELSDEAIRLLQVRPSRINLHDNPLSPDAVERLQELLQAHSHVLRGPHVGALARDAWLDSLTGAERARRSAQWERLVAEEGAGDLFRFLADLSRSSDALNQPEELRRRVWQIIEACVHNTQVREAVFQQAAGPRRCADQVLLILSTLEVRALVVQRTAGLLDATALAPLLQLGSELFRLDQVDRIATEHISRLRLNPEAVVDEVEVHLAYRVGLARLLDLPGQPSHMHYEHFSDVSSTQLIAARAAIVRAETITALSESLAAREFWQEYLRAVHSEAFETLNTPFHERLEALLEQAWTLGERVYLERVAAVSTERTAAERALLLRLTREAYERDPRWQTRGRPERP
ncbi:MAG: NEL-type E3 ubiquitin ligase domain-containing protein [Gammaproteobacteria bacterium]